MTFVLVSAVISGYALFHYLTHPTSKVWYKLPHIQLTRRIQISPSFRFFARGRVLHLHHWVYCALFLAVAMNANGGIADTVFTKGMLLGGLLQGFSVPEARRLLYKQTDAWKNFSRDTSRKPFTFPPEKLS